MLFRSQFTQFINAATLWLRFRTLAVADKEVALTFGADALVMDVQGTHSSVPWTNFIARVERPDALFLKIGQWEAMTIPRRAFPDDASWRAALAFLREKVPHGEA